MTKAELPAKVLEQPRDAVAHRISVRIRDQVKQLLAVACGVGIGSRAAHAEKSAMRQGPQPQAVVGMWGILAGPNGSVLLTYAAARSALRAPTTSRSRPSRRS